jgi:hypothetical protein
LIAAWFAQAEVVVAAVAEWTCAWVLTERRERQGEEVWVLRRTVALPLPSSPTMEAPYTDSSISRTCLYPLFVQIEGQAIHRRSGIRSLRNETGLVVFCGKRAKARLSAALFLPALRLVERLHITSVPARYPQLGGVISVVSPSLIRPPSNRGVTPSFAAAMFFVHWETIENFGAVTYGVQAICRAGI